MDVFIETSSIFIWFGLKHTTTELNEMDVSIETQIIPKLLVVGRIDPRYPYYKVRPLPLSRSYTADNSLNFSGVTSASVDVSIELNKLLFELKHPCITCFN